MPIYLNGQEFNKSIEGKVKETMEKLGVTPNHIENMVSITTDLKIGGIEEKISNFGLEQDILKQEVDISYIMNHLNEYLNNKFME